MKFQVDITPSLPLQGLFKRAASMPQESLKAIAAALKQAGPIIVQNALEYRFTLQKGPFPVSEHKLGVKSRRLRQSIDNTAPQIQEGSSTVTMGFGSNVKYFGIHEFGFSGSVGVKAHSRKNGQNVRAHSRFVKIAAREPMQTELRNSRTADLIYTLAKREILKVVDGSEKGGPA
jgi:phage gpG-like protein